MSISNHEPNRVLRYQRQLRGWSLQRVADEIRTLCIERTNRRPGINGDMVGEWERGVKKPGPFYREMLCLLYGCTADKLDLLDTPATPEDLAAGEDMNTKRRELLRFLRVAGSALAFSFPVDWDRISHAVTRPLLLDSAVLENLGVINRRFWSLYLAASAKSTLLDGVTGQLKTLVQFLRESHAQGIHRQICALASDAAQLAGEIHFDRQEPELATSCYSFAAEAAREARAYDLWSCALLRSALSPLYAGHFDEAIPRVKEAGWLAMHGDLQLPTRFWAAAVEAETEAGCGRLQRCLSALEKAQGVATITEASPGWTRFETARLPALRGACFVRLQRPNLAVPALQEALEQFACAGRRRGMVLLDLAVAAIQQNEIEQACLYLSEVAEIAALGSSSFLRSSAHKVRLSLQPFASSSAVKAVDQQLLHA
jgi:transcriptional regulator with XRE-family HTH domain